MLYLISDEKFGVRQEENFLSDFLKFPLFHLKSGGCVFIINDKDGPTQTVHYAERSGGIYL